MTYVQSESCFVAEHKAEINFGAHQVNRSSGGTKEATRNSDTPYRLLQGGGYDLHAPIITLHLSPPLPEINESPAGHAKLG